MFAIMRSLLFGCCLVVALAGWGVEFLGQAAFLGADGLWVQALPGGAPRKVASGHVWAPRFSNSGRWLLYQDDNTLRSALIADLAHPQTPPHRVHGEVVCWSPTADMLAYTRGYTGIYLTAPGAWHETTVRPGTRNTTNMEAVFPGAVAELAWSPDGKRLAYILMREPRRDYPQNNWGIYCEIHVIAADGRRDRTLWRDTPYGTNVLGLRWTPDGRYLCYFREEAQSAAILAAGTPLYALPVAGGRPKLLSNSTFSYLDAVACSPDGRQIAISEGRGQESWANRQLIIASPRTGVRQTWTRSADIALSPAWSPQGGIRGYVTAPAGSARENDWRRIEPLLARRRIELEFFQAGAGIQPTQDTVNREENPQWSADGNHLLYVRITPDGHVSLRAYNRQTGTAQQLVDNLLSREHQFSDWDGFYGGVQWGDLLTIWRGQRLDAPAWEQRG